MKLFSTLSIVAAVTLIVYFLFIGLPKIAEIQPHQKYAVGEKAAEHSAIKKPETTENYILRDKCNSYATAAVFNSANESDAFLESCLAGNETSKINVIKNESTTSTTSSTTISTSTEPRLSGSELVQKCNDFMTRARFDSQKAADAFLKNCLAGK
jgi:hypothetical protein